MEGTMDRLVEITEKPVSEEIYMIAGWEQWADAGAISSGLPPYLVERTGAQRIGEIKPDGFYIFQVPGTHHFLRPEIKLEGGYRQSLSAHTNRFFYTGDEQRGLVVFLGEEPHTNAERYADAFLDAVEAFGVKRVVALGGVYGAMPYDKAREVHCIYSLPTMKDELSRYAVKFSDYEGGVTISTFIADRAERRGIEMLAFYAFVPSYDFSQEFDTFQGVRLESDSRAWYEVMRRLNYMFGLPIDLSGLQQRSEELMAGMDAKLAELEKEMPQLHVRHYLEKVSHDFEEEPFLPLDDMWERELGDIL
jgi:predicted ATP-grasp superfamily ATP-dependent carboligase